MGGVCGRENKRVRGPVIEREKERARGIEIESDRGRACKKEKWTESTMRHVLHTAVFSGTQLPRASPYPSTFTSITLVRLSGNEILSGLETVVGEVYLRCRTLVIELQQAHFSTAFSSISKALAHDSVETHLKMFRLLNT